MDETAENRYVIMESAGQVEVEIEALIDRARGKLPDPAREVYTIQSDSRVLPLPRSRNRFDVLGDWCKIRL